MELSGRTIGHITVGETLGSGGMGEVYRGFDERLRRAVAVKVLRSERRFDGEARRRFVREARILSQLDHPGICRVYGLVEEPDADFLVLEQIEGQTLRQVMAAGVAHEQALQYAVQIARALDAAHQQQVVHRDLKPENVMITAEGTVKVLDFGIARSARARVEVVATRAAEGSEERVAEAGPAASGFTGEGLDETTVDVEPGGLVDDPALLFQEAAAADEDGAGCDAGSPLLLTTVATRAGSLVGTVRYMSPEQAGRGEVTTASDLYSFGILLQELLTGTSAYSQASDQDLLLRVYRGQTIAPAGLDAELVALLEELQRVDPAARPSAAEAADRLLRHLDRPRRRRRRRLRIAAASLVGLALVSAGGMTLTTRLRASQELALTQRLARTAAEIEWLLRAEHLSPLHDIRPAIASVTDRMQGLEGQLGRGSDQLDSGLHTALGRAELALGELDEARAHLEQAVRLDPGSADAHLALALTLAAQYRRGLQGLQAIRSGELKRLERGRLDRELREPAIEHLKAGGDAGTGSGTHVRALLAALEGSTAEAEELARRQLELQPWHYETELLRGDLLLDEARACVDRGEYDEAQRLHELVAARYQAAAAVGASDPGTHESLCNLMVERLHASVYGSGEEAEPLRDLASAACAAAVAAEPDLAGPHVLLARSYQLWATRSAHLGEDAASWLGDARKEAETAVALEPSEAAAHSILGLVAQLEGELAVSRGQDPTPAFEESVQQLEQASALGPGPIPLNNLGFTHCQLAFWKLDRGDDPSPALAQAIASYEAALALDASSSMVHHNLGLAFQTRGQWLQEIGADPTASYEQAVAAYSAAREINPTRPLTLSNLGFVQAAHAEYLLATGRDPGPLLDAAEASLHEALETSPGDLLAATNLGSTWLIRGRARLEQGLDPGAALAQARQWYRQALARSPSWIPALGNLIVVERDSARYAALAGRAPAQEVREAEQLFTRARAVNPGLVFLFAETAEVHLADARYRRGAGLPVEVAARRAAELAAMGLESAPQSRSLRLVAARAGLMRAWEVVEHGGDADALLASVRDHMDTGLAFAEQQPTAPELAARAELELLVARQALAHGEPPDEAVTQGLDAVRQALEANPSFAEAEALRAHLLLLDRDRGARQGGDEGAEACAAMVRAVQLNPLLAGQLGEVAGGAGCELPAGSTPRGAREGGEGGISAAGPG